MSGNNNFKERKSWMSTQRQTLGPDWTTRIRADILNRDIKAVDNAMQRIKKKLEDIIQ